jgi:hypothetical protein
VRINAKEALNDRKTKPRFLMGAWGFVFLAYGIAWCAILIYWLALNRPSPLYLKEVFECTAELFFCWYHLIPILAGSTLRAGEPPSDVTCAIWNRASEGEKLMYAVGYSVGATHAAATAGLRLEKDRLAREILMHLLPENYRFGSIVLEVDALCRLAAASDKSNYDGFGRYSS